MKTYGSKLLRALVPNPGTLVILALFLFAQSVGALPFRSAPEQAQIVPSLLSYQGRLTNVAGSPVGEGLYVMRFSLYDLPAGGEAFWTELHEGTNAVPVLNGGFFNVLLGELVPLPQPFPGNEVYLGITVGSDSEMVPRERLTGVPFAATAGYATLAEEANRLLSLNTYRFWRVNDPFIHYIGPSGVQSSLDFDQCSVEGWCCTTDQAICYYHKTGETSVLEFSLDGASSIACTLLHEEDDSPLTNIGLHFATDMGNGCHIGKPCARLIKEGATGSPITTYVTYHWLCLDTPTPAVMMDEER